MRRQFLLTVSMFLLFPALSFAQPNQSGPGNAGPGNNRPGPGNGGPSNGRPDNNRPRPGNRPERPGNPGPGRPGMGPGRPNPPAMRPPGRPQFSWRGRFFNPVHGPAFRYPPGYAYRRWSIGASLPALFLSTSFYYDDWRGLGIDPPPPGRRWVRYGPDLLLVNVRTRRVEDVVYGVFY